MPAVRIVIPTYQRAGMIGEALASVLAQTFRDFEVIVADDGSTDGTAGIVEAIVREDARLRYLPLQHGGISATRNAALAYPGAFTYVAFLDSDDLWVPNHLEVAIGALNARPAAALFFAPVETHDPNHFLTPQLVSSRGESDRRVVACGVAAGPGLERPGLYEIDPAAFIGGVVRNEFNPITSTVVLRAAAVGARWFNPTRTTLEDCDLYLRVVGAGHAAMYHDRPHCQYRLHGGNSILGSDLSSLRTLEKCRSWLAYAVDKMGYCQSQADRVVVRREIARVAYLAGQCYAEQRRFAEARRAYVTGLCYLPGHQLLRGLASATLPRRARRPPSDRAVAAPTHTA